MKTGWIVLCRYNSSRLPGKILREIEGKAVLKYIVERLEMVAEREAIVVATSRDGSDDRIEEYCHREGIECYRGSLEDVAGRFLSCAGAYGFEYAGRINGDNIFVDPATVARARDLAEEGRYDFITNVPGRSFPFGMSVEVVRRRFFEEVLKEVRDPRLREHVTLALYEDQERGKRAYLKAPVEGGRGLQLAVDQEEDLERARRLVGRMRKWHGEYGLEELLELMRSSGELVSARRGV